MSEVKVSEDDDIVRILEANMHARDVTSGCECGPQGCGGGRARDIENLDIQNAYMRAY